MSQEVNLPSGPSPSYPQMPPQLSQNEDRDEKIERLKAVAKSAQANAPRPIQSHGTPRATGHEAMS